MSNPKKLNELPFSFYPVADGDTFDIGFKIKGYEFRFINPRKQERSQDRPWKMLTESDLPPAFVNELKKRRPGFFGSDGLHRRMNENILAFCPTEAYNEVKKSLYDRNREDMEKIVGRRNVSKNFHTESEFEALPGDLSENFKN